MQRKFLASAAVAAVLGMLALAPIPAFAKGAVVATKENYSSGTIVVHTNQRRLYLFSATARRSAIRSASAATASAGPA